MTRTEQARKYARSVRGRFQMVSEEAGLNYWWLSRFAQGVIKAPAADKIDALLAHRDARAVEQPNNPTRSPEDPEAGEPASGGGKEAA